MQAGGQSYSTLRLTELKLTETALTPARPDVAVRILATTCVCDAFAEKNNCETRDAQQGREKQARAAIL